MNDSAPTKHKGGDLSYHKQYIDNPDPIPSTIMQNSGVLDQFLQVQKSFYY
jgi:hypothetical protein